MKTSELVGPALAYAVAVAYGYRNIHTLRAWKNKHGAQGPAQVMVGVTKNGANWDFSPQDNWDQAGPIIEREEITITPCNGAWDAMSRGYFGYGPTPLIAAMRCYVASKLGDEVEIPPELRS